MGTDSVFDRAFEYLMNHEVRNYGKKNEIHYTADPNDPGGETNWGISAKYNPGIDIKNLTKEAAKALAHNKYWLRIHLDQVAHPAVAIKMFDTYFGPMSGVAVIGAQRALRKMEACCCAADGKMGPETLGALNRLAGDSKGAMAFLVRYVSEIRDYTYKHSSEKYWNGHIKRALEIPEVGDDHR